MSEIIESLSLENLFNLDMRELEVLSGLIPVAKEATEAYELIRKTYRFAIGEDSIVVWSDSCNKELLTHAGIWQARYLHQKYDVQCTKEEIFRHYKAKWLIDNGYVPERTARGSITEEAMLSEACKYFQSFVKRTRNKNNSKRTNDEFV